MDYEGFLELVKQRRSIRSFKPEPIPDGDVDKIIEAARWAPSGANSQPWEFIVVKKPELRDRIVQFCQQHQELTHQMELTREPEFRYPSVAKPPTKPPGFAAAPVFIIVCGDERTKEACPVVVTYKPDPTFFSGLASAFLYLHLAAATLGLAAQWVSGTNAPFVQCLIKDLLGIPKELEIYDMMAVGHAAAEPKHRLVRDRADLVHYDGYDRSKFRTDEKIRDFILALRRS